MKKTIFVILSLLILNVWCGIGNCCSYDDDDTGKSKSPDSDICFLNFDNNIEQLLIKLSIDNNSCDTNSIYIIPIKAKDNETQVTVVNKFPDLIGRHFEKYFDDIFNERFLYIMSSQIYAHPLLLYYKVFVTKGGEIHDRDYNTKLSDSNNILNTKILSAENKDEVINFISRNNIKITQKTKDIIDLYAQKDYIFVLAWFNNEVIKNKTHKINDVGLLISFKTLNIFFPFGMPSINKGPISFSDLYIIGNRKLNIYSDYDRNTEYLIMRNYFVPFELSNFFFDIKHFEVLCYTKISINSGQKLLQNNQIKTIELSNGLIGNSPPDRLYIKSIIINNLFIFSLLIFLIISCVSSVIASKITFANNNPSLIKFTLLGFSNIFTLLGVILAAKYFNIKINFTNGNLIKLKSKYEYYEYCLAVSLIIVFIYLLFIGIDGFYNLFGLLIFFIFIFICVLIAESFLRSEDYNIKFITKFSLIFNFITFISLIIIKKII